ncbi:hypothetical protein [Tsukamurella pseudospumae]|uniref:hypothetical protein n=1 Tax=Tsukamurella pseudospumae TaxID=239498 RepID=UPI000A3FC3A3|nr:hypothetical protein [Tsukamurella pseudospumae]
MTGSPDRDANSTVDDPDAADIERRLAAARRLAGSGTGWFPDGYLEALRSEWPD